MNKKFVVHPKDPGTKDSKVVMTIRIDRELQEEYDKLAGISNRSRNELICMAMRYALENLEFVDYGEE
ncbi:CopG family transcriptional regulator [Enterocloster citroniae]|uniref:CopG family transcriptional regulator n=1 Tax=Enterocloster citroniae TaxID=358743 RepID=UPI0034A353EA